MTHSWPRRGSRARHTCCQPLIKSLLPPPPHQWPTTPWYAERSLRRYIPADCCSIRPTGCDWARPNEWRCAWPALSHWTRSFSEHLRGHGEPRLEEIPTAPLMAVTLKGDGFRIVAYSDEEQIVTREGITTWEFDIRALKRGLQRLIICVSLRIPLESKPSEHKSIPVREATIDVQVGAPALVGHFVAANWQWFIATAIAIAAVLVAVLH